MVGKANESEIFINDFRSKALIDSGSMISTISSSVLNRLKPVPEIKDLSNLGLTVNVAGGATLPYLGYVEVKIKVNFISSEDIFVPLLVVNATEYNKNVPVVVGTNIIKIYQAYMSKGHGKGVPKEWNLAFKSMTDQVIGKVRSTKKSSIKLKPMSVMTVSC